MAAAAAVPPLSLADRHLWRSPGPASYNVKDEWGRGSGAGLYSFSARSRAPRDYPTPGPDKYSQPNLPIGGPSMSFGHKQRRRGDREDVPGPGAYDSKVKALGGPQFSFSSRLRPVRSDVTPAPNQYAPAACAEKIKEKAPAFSMASKFRRRQRDGNPGPGSYSLDKIPKFQIGQGPKYSLSGRSRQPRDDPLPSPGAYSFTSTIGQSSPSYSMGARTRVGVNFGHFGGEMMRGVKTQ